MSDHTTDTRPLRKQAVLTPCPNATAHHVFLVLAAYAHDKRLTAFPSAALIGLLTGRSISCVRQALADLRDAGRVVVVEASTGQRPTLYRVVMDPSGDGTPLQAERRGKPKQAALPGLPDDATPPVHRRGTPTAHGRGGVAPTGATPPAHGRGGVVPTGSEGTREGSREGSREGDAHARGTIEQLVEAWNAMAGKAGLTVVELAMLPLTARRRHDAILRLGEIPWPDIERALAKVAASRYLTGREKNYRLDFGGFVTPGRIVEILEGKFDDVGPPKPGVAASPEKHEHYRQRQAMRNADGSPVIPPKGRRRAK